MYGWNSDCKIQENSLFKVLFLDWIITFACYMARSSPSMWKYFLGMKMLLSKQILTSKFMFYNLLQRAFLHKRKNSSEKQYKSYCTFVLFVCTNVAVPLHIGKIKTFLSYCLLYISITRQSIFHIPGQWIILQRNSSLKIRAWCTEKTLIS